MRTTLGDAEAESDSDGESVAVAQLVALGERVCDEHPQGLGVDDEHGDPLRVRRGVSDPEEHDDTVCVTERVGCARDGDGECDAVGDVENERVRVEHPDGLPDVDCVNVGDAAAEGDTLLVTHDESVPLSDADCDAVSDGEDD